MSEPKRILFLMTDQQRWDTIHALGCENAITPNLDRLAAEAAVFENCYKLPLILDDSFVLSDDKRLRSAPRWLCGNYKAQILMFTCHQGAARVLEDSGIQHHLIRL